MQQSSVDEFLHFDDAHERLAAIVDRARRSPRLAPDERSPAHHVRGCASAVWLIPELRDARCHFRADADSPLIRGLVVLLADYFSDSTPAEILAADTNPLAALDLIKNLSPTRRHGLAAVHATIRAFAQSVLPEER